MKKNISIKGILEIVSSIIYIFAGILVLIQGITFLATMGDVTSPTIIATGFLFFLFAIVLVVGGVLLIVKQFKEIKNKSDNFLVSNFAEMTKVFLGGVILISSVIALIEYAGVTEILLLSVLGIVFGAAAVVLPIVSLFVKKLSKQTVILLGILASVFMIIAIIINLLTLTTIFGIIGLVFFIVADLLLTITNVLVLTNNLKVEETTNTESKDVNVDVVAKTVDEVDATKLEQSENKEENDTKDNQ